MAAAGAPAFQLSFGIQQPPPGRQDVVRVNDSGKSIDAYAAFQRCRDQTASSWSEPTTAEKDIVSDFPKDWSQEKASENLRNVADETNQWKKKIEAI